MSDDPIRVGDTTLEELESDPSINCKINYVKPLCALVRAQAAERDALVQAARGLLYEADVVGEWLAEERSVAFAPLDGAIENMRALLPAAPPSATDTYLAGLVLPAAPEEGR